MTRNDIREYSSRFDISGDECDRIAAASETEDDFVRIWESEDWWTDPDRAA
jgi:hypothetical protein